MKSGLKIFLAIVAIVIVAGIIFFFWQRGQHLPRAQTPQPPGTFIPKNQLVFAGYKTPEAALESFCWASLHGDYEATIASFQPDQQAEMKKEFGSPQHFKSEGAKESSRLQSVKIIARKNVSSDNAELKFQIVENGSIHNKGGTNLLILPIVKIRNEWKIAKLEDISGYETNWDNSGDIVTFSN